MKQVIKVTTTPIPPGGTTVETAEAALKPEEITDIKVVKNAQPTIPEDFSLMDEADEEQIIKEMEQGMTQDDYDDLVYIFTDRVGKQVMGLTYYGTKRARDEFNHRKLTQMTVTDKLIATPLSNGNTDYAVYAYDEKRKIGSWGAATSKPKFLTKAGTEIEDPHATAKAVSKAQRNALRGLFPDKLLAKMIAQWVKAGQVKTLSAQQAATTMNKLRGTFGKCTNCGHPLTPKAIAWYSAHPSAEQLCYTCNQKKKGLPVTSGFSPIPTPSATFNIPTPTPSGNTP